MNDFEPHLLPLDGLGAIVCELTDKQAGKLFKCILAKLDGVNLEIEDQSVKIAFIAIELLSADI